MSDTGPPPVIPSEFQIYNSYEEDPKWQLKFTIIWTSVLAFFVLVSLPHLVRSLRNRRLFTGFFGVLEDLDGKRYDSIPDSEKTQGPERPKGPRGWEVILGRIGSVFWWTLPGFELNAGQLILIIGYIVAVVLCIVINAPLISNSNRAGFIALAQFPIVFLFATKNSVVSLLLGPGHGYEKLNFIHRWSGRCMFFGGLLHGALWIRNHLQYSLPILGQQKETSGVAALALLCIIVLTSLRPVRRYFYQIFFVIHVLAFVAFFITICYHTIYASPWIFPPLAFYGLDILLRMLRYRIKDAILVPVDKQMTLIHIPHSTGGWTAGQHVRLRVFFSGRIFESHPLTILSAPPDISCITSLPQGITLGARAVGDWSRALSEYARQVAQEITELEGQKEKKEQEKQISKQKSPVEVPVQVMLDGPYGGSSVDLGRYENVLLFAGGAGATFTIGLLDDIVGRCVRQGRKNGEKTRRIEFAWCVRSFGSIEWFAPVLMDIATVAASSSSLDLHISVYVTCLCNPEAIPPIPNSDVTIIRPSIYKVLVDLVTPPSQPRLPTVSEGNLNLEDTGEIKVEARIDVDEETSESFNPSPSNRLPWIGLAGGLALCASGPEGLTREAANAVARLQATSIARDVGVVGLHTEVFAL